MDTVSPMPNDAPAGGEDIRCPVCGGASLPVESLPDGQVRARLGRVFGSAPPPDVAIGDYGLRQCDDCELAFADPMRAGGDAFYAWVTGFEKYHSGPRWEWRRIASLLADTDAGEGGGGAARRVLELGCGQGLLLETLAATGCAVQGLDISAASVDAARARGLDVQLGGFGDIGARYGAAARWDAIILSHVLEHIEAPRALMADLAGRLAPGGRILVAVPYSPMSREILNNDIMNLPPHHMTRWNARSLERLAAAVGARLTLHARGAKSPLKRAIRFTWVSVTGTETGVSRPRRLWIVATHPRRFARMLRTAFGREKLHGRIAPDEVLAEFTFGGDAA